MFENRHKRAAAQILFWLCIIGFISLMFSQTHAPPEFIYRNIIFATWAAVLTLLNVYWLAPAFFYKYKYSTYGLVAGACIFLFVIIAPPLEQWLLSHVLGVSPQQFDPRPQTQPLGQVAPPIQPVVAGPRYFITFIIFTGILMFSTIWESIQLHRQRERRAIQIENEKLSTELKFLKSQINPHFLFNALNDVYTLSIIKSDQTPEVVMKLAEMLRYMLYHSKHERVLLEQEVGYIKNYIDLQQLKDDDPTALKISYKINNPNAHIAPMILIPLVENAFKHSAVEDNRQKRICMSLNEKNNQLELAISNSFPAQSHDHGQIDSTGGIGLHNVQRRLELEYAGAHELLTNKTSDTFSVHLTIQLG